MKNVTLIAGIIFSIVLFSCQNSKQNEETNSSVSVSKSDSIVKLCGKCGEIKGSDKCCKQDVVKCEKCGLNKGSPGCCKIKN